MIAKEPLSATEILLKFSGNTTAAEIEQLSSEILPSAYKSVIIDLSEVYHLNYEILGKLHMLKLDLTVRSKILAFQGCSAKLLNMLKLLKFDKTIKILNLSPQEHQADQKPQKYKGRPLTDDHKG